MSESAIRWHSAKWNICQVYFHFGVGFSCAHKKIHFHTPKFSTFNIHFYQLHVEISYKSALFAIFNILNICISQIRTISLLFYRNLAKKLLCRELSLLPWAMDTTHGKYARLCLGPTFGSRQTSHHCHELPSAHGKTIGVCHASTVRHTTKKASPSSGSRQPTFLCWRSCGRTTNLCLSWAQGS